MTKLKLLGAAAVVLSSALAGPAMAQQMINPPSRCAQYDPNGNCMNMNKGPNNHYTGNYRRHEAAYRNDRNGWRNDNWNDNSGWHDSWNDNRWDRRDSGFWPSDVAADVVGGAVAAADAAVGTAGAIAAAPFHGASYAYDNGGANNGWNGYDSWN